MFCQRCGNEVNANSKFCNYCGAALRAAITEPPTTQRSLSMEITSLQVDVEDESEVIALHQKFGWRFVSTQEINNSYTDVHTNYIGNGQTTVTSTVYNNNYIKLTFERDRNMPNYNILQEKYNEYIDIYNELKKVRDSKDKRHKEFYFICIIPGLIAAVIAFILMKPIAVEIEMGFLGVLLGLIVGATVFAFSVAIGLAVTGPKVKGQIRARSEELRSRMYVLAKDAERYMYF